MEKTVLLLIVLGLVAIVECGTSNLKNIRRKRVPALPMETERRKVCINELGCYADTNPGVNEKWYTWQSFSQTYQDNHMRDSREAIHTQFRWWAPGAQKDKDSKWLSKSILEMELPGFDPGLKVKFLVHGYFAGDAEWATEMKDAFLRKERCNVFIVDWKKGAATILFGSAVANTWVVGAELGSFIVQLVDVTGLNVNDIHIVGHSLGAHISGFAGKWVKDKLGKPVGRITGLDPAGPQFYNNVPGERLDVGDAAFVDVIHTNWANYRWFGLGLFKTVGHFDFYPNGGSYQPGCPVYTKLLSTTKFTCSHSRAEYLFIESIESDSCKFLADQCTTWEEYKEGKCPSGKKGTLRVQMGYHADEYKQYIDGKQQKSFFLETNAEPPYCKGD